MSTKAETLGTAPTEPRRIIGKRLEKKDALAKAQGRLPYAADFSASDMLYAKVVRSPYAVAAIAEINTESAKTVPGVRAVLTAKDIPHNSIVSRFGQSTDLGRQFEGTYRVLAEDQVRYYGEPVVLIAADSPEIAEKAAELIDVEYEPMPGVFTVQDAMKQGAPGVGGEKSNVVSHFEVRRGNVEEAFASADVIVENTYTVPMADHAYLEPESGMAWMDENGVLVIRVATQVIEHCYDIADILALSHSQVRVAGTWVGGGFGGKEDMTVEPYIAVLAWATKRPVKLTFTRQDSLIGHGKRHPFTMTYKTGVKRTGELVAVKAELIADAGAYVTLTPWVLLYATANACGPYEVPHVEISATAVLTNNCPSSAYRGFGAVQPNVAYESQMDELARQLGMGPVEFRRKNLIQQGSQLPHGHHYDRPVLADTVGSQVWEAIQARPLPSPRGDLRFGRGIAYSMTSYGRLMFLRDTSRCWIRLERDGTAVVRCGVPDIGGGQVSSLRFIVCEELGLGVDQVEVYNADSVLTPLAGTTTATRQLYMSGNATLAAAHELKRRLSEKAKSHLGPDIDRFAFEDGYIISQTDNRRVALSEIINECYHDGVEMYYEAQFNAPVVDIPTSAELNTPLFADYTFGAQAVDVAVDTKTGKVDVMRVVNGLDVGTVINRLNCEGQMEGGTVQNLGYALTEEVTAPDGIMTSTTFGEYLIPTTLDVPDIETIIIESGTGVGPYGAKGVGEPSCNGIAPAILNAIQDAVGIRVTSLPASPERVLSALQAL